jgi:hypothetical protein
MYNDQIKVISIVSNIYHFHVLGTFILLLILRYVVNWCRLQLPFYNSSYQPYFGTYYYLTFFYAPSSLPFLVTFLMNTVLLLSYE